MENIAIKQQKRKKKGWILQAMIFFVLFLTMTLSNLSLKLTRLTYFEFESELMSFIKNNAIKQH